jgi:uroporphyrinogen decarboxylase
LKILDALQGKNQGRPPVWLMRQAGRYLPEYQALREKHSLKNLFFTTEHIVDVTKMPLKRFGVDAAILFSDITAVAEVMGLRLEFQEGPRLFPEVTRETMGLLQMIPEKYDPILEAITELKKELKVPLLGFCGAPFTVASYLVGGMEKALLWMRNDPVSFEKLLGAILQATIWTVQSQEKRGVDAIQIFDSWANVLNSQEYEKYCLAPVQKIVDAIKVPSLFFMREPAPYLEKIPCALSLDWTVSLKEARLRTKKPLQGNLSPEILFQPLDVIRRETKALLELMRNDPAFILNLGHGVLPKTPVEAVQCFVEMTYL